MSRKPGMFSKFRRAATLVKVGFAARRLRKARGEENRRIAQQALAALLADARGVPMKIGQFIATVQPGSGLDQLTRGIEPLPLETVLPLLDEILGHDHRALFREFLPASAAATLGQVHRARLQDGREAAVKLQYPDIAEAVEAEMKLAGLVPSVGPARRWNFDLGGYVETLRANMWRELDYLDEAQRQHDFRAAVQSEGLVVPEVLAEHCRPAMLVQSWEDGDGLEQAAAWSLRDRLNIARILLDTLFRSLFLHGQVHGDPHPGNYRFRPWTDTHKSQVVLLDFGCTVPVPEPARLALLKLVLSVRGEAPADHLACFAAMGFEPAKLQHIDAALPAVSAALLAPFSREGFELADWKLGERFENALGDLRWWFRSAGPPSLFLLMRAFQGLVIQLKALDVNLPWWPVLQHALGSQRLAQAREFTPPAPDVKRAPARPGDATLLRVRIDAEAGPELDLVLPASEALKLRALAPPAATDEIEAAGVDLRAIEQRLAKQGLKPQLLLEHQGNGRTYRIQLE